MNYLGKWFIKEMDMWDSNYINMEVEGYIEFYNECSGNFQFGLVKGDIIYKIQKVKNKEVLKIKFTGVDELDPVSGNGWLEIINSRIIEGEISFNNVDISGFTAERQFNNINMIRN